MTIADIINGVLTAEGGYVNDPADRGGETNYGITIATARSAGYLGTMRDLPRETAFDIYYRQYVKAPGFEAVSYVSMAIAAELVDTGVNMGPGVPSKWLQRCLNGLNRQGTDYADIGVDGDIGAKTVDALRSFISKRGTEGEARLLKLLNALQGARYLELAEGRAANEAFLYGWLARI